MKLFAVIIPEDRDESGLAQLGKGLGREGRDDVAAVENVFHAASGENLGGLRDIATMIVCVRDNPDSHRYPP